VAGVALGSLAWVTTLAASIALVRHRLGDGAMRAADAIAGLGLLGFGGSLAVSTLRHD